MGRQVQQRLSALENPIQQRIGSFVLTDNNFGSLVAHSPAMTPTVLAGADGFATLLQQATAAAGSTATSSTTPVDSVTGLTIGGVVSLIQGLLQNGVQLAESAGETGLQDFFNLLAGVLDLTGEIEYTAWEVATGLEGFLTNLSTSGVLALAGLALGALPSGITLAVGGLTGLATGIETWLASGGSLPSGVSLAVADITGLASGIESWLAGGGALPSGVSVAVSEVTGLATGIESWLASGGALPSGVSLAVSEVSGLATGIESWLAGGGALPSGATLAVSEVTGLASGIEAWLASGGGLPSGVTLAGSQLTGTVSNTIVSSVLGLSSLGADVESYVSSLGSVFPKTLPWTIGTSTNTTLSNLAPMSALQQLIDGIVGNGTVNNSPAAAVGRSISTWPPRRVMWHRLLWTVIFAELEYCCRSGTSGLPERQRHERRRGRREPGR